MSSSISKRGGGVLAAGCAFLLGGIAALGCASTQVDMGTQYAGRLPRPQRVLVFPFATTPEEVRLDSSPTVTMAWKHEGLSPDEEEQKVAHEVAQALAKKLVTKIQALGMPAQLVTGAVPSGAGPTLAVSGQFLSIDEGSRAERVTIGLGAGHSEVRTAVQVAELLPEGRRLVDQFEVDAQSGKMPGMAETMGAGAAAGHLATSAAVSVAKSAASEKFGDNVEADAERTAEKVAKVLSTFFVRHGWIAPPAGGTP